MAVEGPEGGLNLLWYRSFVRNLGRESGGPSMRSVLGILGYINKGLSFKVSN